MRKQLCASCLTLLICCSSSMYAHAADDVVRLRGLTANDIWGGLPTQIDNLNLKTRKSNPEADSIEAVYWHEDSIRLSVKVYGVKSPSSGNPYDVPDGADSPSVQVNKGLTYVNSKPDWKNRKVELTTDKGITVNCVESIASPEHSLLYMCRTGALGRVLEIQSTTPVNSQSDDQTQPLEALSSAIKSAVDIVSAIKS